MLPVTREVWRNPEARFIQIRTTVGTPQFFDRDLEGAYYALGLAQADRVGETFVQQLIGVADEYIETEWPTQADQLRHAMETALTNSEDQVPIEARLLGFAANLLRETNPSPALRAAILEVLADLPLELEDLDPDGSITIGVTYRNPLLIRDAITLSQDGQLLAETTTLLEANKELAILEGTQVATARYQLPTLTDGLEGPLSAG